MVDALRRAHGIVDRNGYVIDLHPSPCPAVVRLGTDDMGIIDDENGALRHAAAGVALAATVDAGMFSIECSMTFAFNTYGDSAEELRDFVAEHWREGRIDDGTLGRMRTMLARTPATRPCVRERVYLTKLRRSS